MSAKYTFLLPAYKSEFFAEALVSIKSQTYNDFKVIVSDDCSPEDLKFVYDKVCGDDTRFTFRRNAENMGGKSLVAHWNLLVDMCESEYIIMASDDDVYEKNFLKEIDLLTKKYPNVDIFRGRVRKINEKSESIALENKSIEFYSQMEFAHRSYENDFLACVSNYVYKTDILKSKGCFIDFPKAWFSDDATNIMMAEKGCATTEMVTFLFRSSDLNISSQWGNPDDSQKKVIASIAFYEWMHNLMSNIVYDKMRGIVEKEYRNKVYWNIMHHIFHCSLFPFFHLLVKSPSDVGLNKPRMILHYFNNKLRCQWT